MKKKTEEILLKRSKRLFKKKDLKILANKKAIINTTSKNNILKEISKFHTQEYNIKNNFPQKLICPNKKVLDYLEKEDLNRYYYSNKIINGSIMNENSDIILNHECKLINSQKNFRKYSMDKYKTRNNYSDMMNGIEYYIDKNGNPNSMKYFKSNNMKENENKPIAYIVQGSKDKNTLIDLKGNLIPKNKDGDYSISKDKILLVKNFDVQHPELRVYGEGNHKVINNENDKSQNNICLNSPNFSPKLYFDYKRITNLLANTNTIENNNFNLFRKKKVNAGNNSVNKINTYLTSPKNMSDKYMFGNQKHFSIQYNKNLINEDENNDDIPIPFKNNVYSFSINNVNRVKSNTIDNLYYNKTESNNFNDKLIVNEELNFRTNNKNILNINDECYQYSFSNIYDKNYKMNNNNNILYKKEKNNNRNIKNPNELYYETNLKSNRCSSAINIFNKKETNELGNTDKLNNYEKNNINNLKIDNIDENKIQKIAYKPKKNHVNRKIIKRKHHSFNKTNFNSQEQPTFSKILNSNDANEDIINYMKKDKYSRNDNYNIKDIEYNNLRFLNQLIEQKKKIISEYYLNSLFEEKKTNKNRHKRRTFCFNNNTNKTDRLNRTNNNKMYIKRNSFKNIEENKNISNDDYKINNIINKYKNKSFINGNQSKNQKLKNLLFTYERLFKRKNSDFQSKTYKNKNKYFNDDCKDDIDYKKNKSPKKKIKYLTPNSTKNKDFNNYIIDKESTGNKIYTLNYDSTKKTNRTNKTNESNRRKYVSCDEKNEFIFNITQSKTLLNNINYDNNLYNYTYRKIKSSIKNKCPDIETNTDAKRKSKKLLNSNSHYTIDNNHFSDNFNKTYKGKNLNINENYFKLLKNEGKESYRKKNLEQSAMDCKEKFINVNYSKEEKNKEYLKNIKKPIIINSQSYIYDSYGSDIKQNSNTKNRVRTTRNNHILNNKTINNCSFRYKNILKSNNITENENDKKEERKFSYDKNYNLNRNNPNNLLLITNITKCPQCHCLFGQPAQLLQKKNNN